MLIPNVTLIIIASVVNIFILSIILIFLWSLRPLLYGKPPNTRSSLDGAADSPISKQRCSLGQGVIPSKSSSRGHNLGGPRGLL